MPPVTGSLKNFNVKIRTGPTLGTNTVNITGGPAIRVGLGNGIGSSAQPASSSYSLLAKNAISASYATLATTAATASVTLAAISGTYAQSASNSRNAANATNALTASLAVNAITASFIQQAVSSSFSSIAISASVAQLAFQSVSASFAASSSFAQAAIQAISASLSQTASFAQTASFVATSSFAQTASFVATASFTPTSSFATTASFVASASYASSASVADASKLFGALNDLRLSSNVPLKNTNNTWATNAASNTFGGPVMVQASGSYFSGIPYGPAGSGSGFIFRKEGFRHMGMRWNGSFLDFLDASSNSTNVDGWTSTPFATFDVGNKRVGIGITPSTPLHVSGTITITSGSLTANTPASHLLGSGGTGSSATVLTLTSQLSATSTLQLNGGASMVNWYNSGSSAWIQYMSSFSDANLYIRDVVNGRMQVTFTPSATTPITSFGTHIRFDLDNTYDIGNTAASRPRNLYLTGNLIGGGNIYTTAQVSGSSVATSIDGGVSAVTAAVFTNTNATNSQNLSIILETTKQITLQGGSGNAGIRFVMGAGGEKWRLDNVTATMYVSGSAIVTGSLQSGQLYVSGSPLILDNAQSIQGKDSGGTARNILNIDSSNNINIARSGTSGHVTTQLFGGSSGISIQSGSGVVYGVISSVGAWTINGTTTINANSIITGSLNVSGAATFGQAGVTGTNSSLTLSSTLSTGFTQVQNIVSGTLRWAYGANVNTAGAAWDLYNYTAGNSAISVAPSSSAVTFTGMITGKGGSSITGSMAVSGSAVGISIAKTPTSTADSSGTKGDISWDDSFVYVKTSAGWKRSALSTF